MIHPLFKKPALLILYILFWIFIAVAQIFFEQRIYSLSFGISLVDGIVSYVIFAFLGLGIWYVVSMQMPEEKGSVYILLYHSIALLFIISLWLWISTQIVDLLFADLDMVNYNRLILPGKAGSGVLIYFIVAAFYYSYLYSERLSEKSIEEKKLKELVNETQLSALKSQINPHFLFNSLNSISYLTISEPEKAQDMVIKLSNFLRYSLKHKENEMVSLLHELEHIQLYLDIEKVRFGDKLLAIFDVSMCENCLVPNMLLQPLYENAIKYGVYETTSQVVITTKAENVDNKMVFTVSNNYDSDAISKKGEGIGLLNIRKRLGLVYGNATLLSVQNENNIFKVTIVLPQK